MPLGMGYTVEGQLTGRESVGGLQLMAFEARPDRLPPRPEHDRCEVVACMAHPTEMGLAAGGQMQQEIYPDEYGVDTWDPEPRPAACSSTWPTAWPGARSPARSRRRPR